MRIAVASHHIGLRLAELLDTHALEVFMMDPSGQGVTLFVNPNDNPRFHDSYPGVHSIRSTVKGILQPWHKSRCYRYEFSGTMSMKMQRQ